MRQDGPTIPHPEWDDSASKLGVDNQETVDNLSALEHGAPADAFPLDLGGVNGPSWPSARPRFTSWTEPNWAPAGYVSMTWFSVSIGANVALVVGLIGVILLSYAGAFPPSAARATPNATSARLVSATVTATATATATPTIAPTATPASGWLTVAPDNLQLGCPATGQNVEYIILTNNGSAAISWQVVYTVPNALVGVAVNPASGQLNPGQNTPIQIQNIAQASGGQNVQGVVQFAPVSTSAGPADNLTYSETAC